MKRILFILVLFISTVTIFGKNELSADNSFDKKVEQLFFKKDVSNASAALIDMLAAEEELKYTKPEGYTAYFTPDGPVGIYTHIFDFNQSPDNSIGFQEGSIIVLVSADESQAVNDITWELQYNNKTDAMNAFVDLYEYLCVPGVVHYVYHGKEIIESAELTNKASKKYPRVSFKLINNKGTTDGKYRIRLSLS
jgi:hypothetical protein